jgi:cytochrome b
MTQCTERVHIALHRCGKTQRVHWQVVLAPVIVEAMNDDDAAPVRVWDLPTRLFHWSLSLAVVAAVVTAKVGGNAMVWHMRLGLFVLALLVFRLVWGFVGGRWSRFSSFLFPPRHVAAYLRGDAVPEAHFNVGHSPLGALSVLALLALLIAQVTTGLVADDEVATTGPLNRFVDATLGLRATGWHEGPGQALIIALVLLHIAAVAFYRWRGNDLIAPMWHGDKSLSPSIPSSRDAAGTRALALAVFAAGAGLAWWIARLGAV